MKLLKICLAFVIIFNSLVSEINDPSWVFSHVEAEVSAPLLNASSTPQINPNQPTKEEVQAFVERKAKEFGVNPKIADWIIRMESNYCYQDGTFNPKIAGDNNHSHGCWQFFDGNKDFNLECAESLSCSTNLAMQWILDGKVSKWSTYRFCRAWFDGCPF